MKIKIFENIWDFRFTKPMKKYYGYCNVYLRHIRISKNLHEKKELNTILHELLHACDKYKDEEWVKETADVLSNVLWKLGWRKNKDE